MNPFDKITPKRRAQDIFEEIYHPNGRQNLKRHNDNQTPLKHISFEAMVELKTFLKHRSSLQ